MEKKVKKAKAKMKIIQMQKIPLQNGLEGIKKEAPVMVVRSDQIFLLSPRLFR